MIFPCSLFPVSYTHLRIYGENKTWSSCISQYHYYYHGTKFAYDANKDIKNAIESIWAKGYNTIANCNNIINHVDDLKTEDFRGGEVERQMIKGEALAARALMHFDLLRLFAPALVSNPTSIYIPYVTEFPYYGGQVALSCLLYTSRGGSFGCAPPERFGCRFPFETPGYAVREDCLYGGYSRGSVVVGYDFVDS